MLICAPPAVASWWSYLHRPCSKRHLVMTASNHCCFCCIRIAYLSIASCIKYRTVIYINLCLLVRLCFFVGSGGMYTVFQKKTWHYIFDDNFNRNCPIAIIFGTLITQIISHRTIDSFFTPHLFSATILPWKTQNTKIHKFRCTQQLIFLWNNKLKFFFHA